ncbi:MAG: uroporphyrinogen decarboxylase [Bacteroidetes bacterium 43-16]|nr:MAG: uroporphyrinogen decarboxylase [Bacteroidetes bacterium 43-16]
MDNNVVEMVGYVAMAVLAISFIPRKLRWVRIINFAGCILFVIYGILLGWKYPLIISNGIIAIIQCYHLLSKKKAATEEKH